MKIEKSDAKSAEELWPAGIFYEVESNFAVAKRHWVFSYLNVDLEKAQHWNHNVYPMWLAAKVVAAVVTHASEYEWKESHGNFGPIVAD